MTPLLQDRKPGADPAPQSPSDSPVVVPDFACNACGAGMKAKQDWCLECGTAAPGRLGARSGWRAAFTVVTVTLLLVGGAVTASYAALTNDAERTASAPAAGSGQPIPAQPAPAVGASPITPGDTGPGVTPSPAPGAGDSAQPQAGTPIIPVKPPAPAKNSPLKIPSTSQAPSTGAQTPPATTEQPSSGDDQTSKGDTADQGGSTTAPKAEIVKFKKDSASTYDPYKRAGAEFGPAKNAIDKSKKTVWDVTLPADGKPIGAGLVVDLGKPYDLRALTLDTPTQGFNVEIYGAVSAKETPVDILDKRWEHLTDIKNVTDGKLVDLRGKSKVKQQLLLIYVTQPATPEDPRVAIGKVTVAGTP